MATLIKTLKQQDGIHQILVTYNGKYYVVSRSSKLVEPETYIFNSDKDGNITDWAEVGGTKGGDVWIVMNSMDEYLYKNIAW